MSTVMSVRSLRFVATALIALCAASAAGAQQRDPYPNCNRQAAGNCTDAGVIACLNQHKGNAAAISQCQMNVNMSCNTQNGCPNSAAPPR